MGQLDFGADNDSDSSGFGDLDDEKSFDLDSVAKSARRTKLNSGAQNFQKNNPYQTAEFKEYVRSVKIKKKSMKHQ